MITETAHDPVCHMDIEPKSAVGTSEYKGVTYYFCARGCKMDFEEDPEGVLKAEAEYDHDKPSPHMMTMQDEAPKKPRWKIW